MSCRALLSVVLAAGLWCSSVAAEAASPETESSAPEPSRQLAQLGTASLADLIRHPRTIHTAVLAGLEAQPELVGPAGERLRSLRFDIETAQSQIRWAEQEQLRRQRTLRNSRTSLARRSRDLAQAIAERELSEGNVRAMSVDAFITGSDQPDLAGLVQADAATAASMATQSLRTDHLARAATDDLVAQRDDALWQENQAERNVAAARSQVRREQQLLTAAAHVETQATATVDDLEPQLAPAERRFERWLLTRTVPGHADLTVVAVNAYYNASQLGFERWPGCRIAWHQLAGVGRVESFHGRFGNSELQASGATSAKILGPQLNGERWLAIPDTDLGELDEDTEWDRAVGPMQFIPTSWAIFAADGNNDGQEDPHNLYDAALAAADHLCGTGLDTEDRFRTALLGYNRSASYGSNVIRFSAAYAEAGLIENPWELAPADDAMGSG